MYLANSAYDALKKIGGTGTKWTVTRQSFALIGTRGGDGTESTVAGSEDPVSVTADIGTAGLQFPAPPPPPPPVENPFKPGAVVAMHSKIHNRFVRMHENGNMDASDKKGKDELPGGWTWERFTPVDGE